MIPCPQKPSSLRKETLDVSGKKVTHYHPLHQLLFLPPLSRWILHSFKKYLGIYYVPDTVLNSEDIAVSRAHVPMELAFQGKEETSVHQEVHAEKTVPSRAGEKRWLGSAILGRLFRKKLL